MFAVNGKTGLVEIKSTKVEFINEISMVIKAINRKLDDAPEIIRDSVIESIVDDDETYAEICKFAIRMNQGKERVKMIKEKFPDLLDENGKPDQEKTLKALEESLEKLLNILNEK